MVASFPIKQALADFLAPMVRITRILDGRWQRFWSYARLRSQIPSLDPSVVVLGMPELHGSRRLEFGCNLYLYRDLYLETQEGGEIILGDDVVISRGVHLVSFKRIEIGAGSMIGEYTSVRDANHNYPETPSLLHPKSLQGPAPRANSDRLLRPDPDHQPRQPW